MKEKSNVGAIVAGSVLIFFGMLTLFGQMFRGLHLMNYLWPVSIIGLGGLFFLGMFLGGKSVAGLAIPGSILSVLGLMMFYQNLSGHWESWAYGWTVILMAVGLGIFIMGLWSQDEDSRKNGLNVLKIGAILFFIFGAFFEVLIFSSLPPVVRNVAFPLVLIALGIFLVLFRSGILGRRRPEAVAEVVQAPVFDNSKPQ